MNRSIIPVLFLPFAIFLTSCARPHVMSEQEIQQIINLSPSTEVISQWGKAAFPENKFQSSIFWPEFELAVKMVVDRFHYGLPIFIKRPSVGPSYGGNPEIDPEFGVPILDTDDALSIKDAVAIEATNSVLHWFAEKGIYPANSNKHICPKPLPLP